MNDVKMDLDDAMRMLVALHEEHMGIHEQLDVLGVPHVAKRDGQWRLSLLTHRLEMAERNLVQERTRRVEAERAVVEEQETARIMLNATLDEAKRALNAERAAHKATRKRLTEDQALLTECRRQRDAAVAERDEARHLIDHIRHKRAEQRIEDGRWVVAGGHLPGADSEYHVYDNETFARSGYARLLQAGVRPYLCRVIEGPGGWDGSGKKDPEKATEVSAPTDVDALLREATAWTPGIVFIDKRGAWDMIRDLAAALRAERARAELAESDEMVRTCAHLRAVLAHFSPDCARGPTVARKAHAFLAGDAADVDVSGPSKARYAIRCAQKAERDAEEEASRLRAVAAAHDEAEANLRAEVQRLRGELEAEKARHEQTKRDHNADAQAKQENLARALKAEAAVKALQEAVESAYAARVKPSGDVVERLVHAYEVAAVGGDVASESGIRAVLVKVAEMVPSEEEIATSLWESDTQAIVTGGRPFDDCHATTKLRYRRSGGVVRSLILSRLGQTKEGAK